MTTNLPGGALLVADLMRAGARVRGISPSIFSYKLPSHGQPSSARSFLTVQRFDKCFRVKEFNGFRGTSTPEVLQYQDDVADATLTIISDAGNLFRRTSAQWPKALHEKSRIIIKLSQPFRDGDLWDLLSNKYFDRVTAIVTADELRNAGVHISRGISWDRTAADFVVEMDRNQILRDLARFPDVLVRFGIDGVLHYRRDKSERFQIYYDPDQAEGDYAENFKGTMSGFGATFCASLALDLYQKHDDFYNAVPQALVSSRFLLDTGYGEDDRDLRIQHAKVFIQTNAESKKFAFSSVPEKLRNQPVTSWSFVRQIVGDNLPELARKIVVSGEIPPGVPIAKFGKLETLDRSEAESYRSIRNLIREYISTSNPARPLSIAVFGQPGGGKSYGITEIANSIGADVIQTGPPVNVAQFTSIRDLVDVFHRSRDIALGGRVPLVFFDEFDSKVEDEPLGWLKYFLSPMQDGLFKDGGTFHPIGRAIFVFAGGTSHSFEEFQARAKPGGVAGLEREAKLPDFISRLRGYINIIGPDPVASNDKASILRRGVMLRSLLTRKYPDLIRDDKADVDPGVLRAFLLVPSYRHGVRSMEALLEMSMLAGKQHFSRSALPAQDQIEMHVDSNEFLRLADNSILA
jgi:hypothetical protein